MRGAYPGSFNPPTVAHLAIAEAAREAAELEHVDLVLSRRALLKEDVERPRLEDRVRVLEALGARLGWLGVVVTERQLVADLADGYDAVILGADKWAQLHDVQFYEGSPELMSEALARLPRVLVAPRPPHPAPPELTLDLPPHLAGVSSTAVRAGRRLWMVPEARAFDDESGAWSDPPRYERWLATKVGTAPDAGRSGPATAPDAGRSGPATAPDAGRSGPATAPDAGRSGPATVCPGRPTGR